MRDDIKYLPITKSNLAKLTNFKAFPSPILLWNLWWISLYPIVWFHILLSLLSRNIIYNQNILLVLTIWHLPLIIVLSIEIDNQFKLKGWSSHPPLKGLLKDVKRFNSLIQSIHINDQLEEAGNLSVKLKDRKKIIEALKLTREDLCRALKTERILRENKKFISRNPALFENNLIALTTLQVDDQASEQGRLLDEALQIALSTQEELRRFQKRDY